MRNTFLLILLILSFASCTPRKQEVKVHHDSDKVKLLETDKAFSKMSEEKGMKEAFIEYIDSNGVLLRPNHLPIVGANAIDFLIQQNDTSFTLSWQPHNGAVAKSGDMGYTYGIWALRPKTKDTVLYGTYVSIWKRQDNGHWKFVLDTGNEGLGQ